jgi:uncharacterized protein (DUF433 family)
MASRSNREAAMDWRNYITTDPDILHGAVRFVGTRIPVTVVLDNLADGAAPAEILRQYPGLTAEHIPAALGYAAELARERVVPIPA